MSEWKRIFEEKRAIPPHNQTSRLATGPSRAFQLVLKQVDGLHVKQSEDGKASRHELRVSLFDSSRQHFFGRTWKSALHEARRSGQEQHSKVRFNEVIYFHTALSLSSVVAVVELVTLSPGPGASQNAVGSGFGLLQLFSARPDSGPAPHGEGRLSLLHGTPRALLHPTLRDPLQMNAVLTVMEGTQLLYSLQPDPALTPIMHLFPPNILVSSHDLIPGVLPPTDNTDVLHRPQALPSLTCVLERVCVVLAPSLEAFDEELLQRLHTDRHNTKLGGQVRAVEVQERRLHVGVHNGWGWVDGPQVLVLEPGPPRGQETGVGSSLTLTSTHTPSPSPSPALTLRGRVELRMVRHPAFSVVFQLEYVFSVPLAAEGKTSSMSVQRTVFMQCVRWSVWSPFSDPCGPSDSACVSLQGGALPNPCGVMVYTADTQQADAGKSVIKFRLSSYVKGATSSTALKAVPKETSPPKKFHSISQDESERELEATPLPSARGPGLSLSQLAATSRYPTMSHTMASPWQQQLPALLAPSPMASAHQLSHVEHPIVASIAHLEVSALEREEMKDDEECDLRELTFTPVHAPVIALGTHVAGFSRTSSRRSLAHLFSSSFPEIRDGLNQVAEVLDPSEAVNFDPQREEADPLQANTLILQFLAFTRVPQAGVGVGWPSCVHFTFQLYCFPPLTTQRMRLLESEGARWPADPCVLSLVSADGTLSPGSPGLQLQYRVDPATLKPGERAWFLRYLALHSLHIDVWDSDSLLLIGSAAVELKHLLRQGRPAVQVCHELEIITTEYLQDTTVVSGHVPAASVYTTVKGRLHLRLGNVGSMVQATPSSMASPPPARSRVVRPSPSAGGFQGGSLYAHAVLGLNARNARRAQRLPEIDGELARLLQSRMREVGGVLPEGSGEAEEVRQRKMDRMAAVRQHENTTPTVQDKPSSMRRREERLRHAEDLRVIEVYRERCKAEGITAMLSQAITTTHTVYATLASAEFFEFLLKNPFNVPQTVTIECDDPELSVIVKAEEWRFLKDLTKTSTPLEAEMFHPKGSGSALQVYLRPKESVYIPLKYQTFLSGHTLPSKDMSSLKNAGSAQFAYKQQSNTILPKSIKAIFRAEDGQPLAICHVRVEPTPHVVDQTFRFYQPELNFLKKAIRLPPATARGTDGHASLHVRCSDPSVICHASSAAPGEPQDIYLKVPGAPSPQIKKFFISVFTDPWLASPAQIWQVYVHYLQRLDVSCVAGTRSWHSLVLRGTQAIRKVQCYTSHPLELQVDPGEVFALPALAVQDVRLGVRLLRPGASFCYVTAVDVDLRQLVAAWLLAVTCRQPLLSRAFEIRVPVAGGRGNNKKFSFTNPYSSRRGFQLCSDHPDLLQFKEERFQIEGGENYSIGLRFAPSQSAGTQEILIFINDMEDKNEETYCVRVVYR